MQYTQHIKNLGQAVCKKDASADPNRWGSLPFALREHRKIMPTLMHGKKITFGDKVSEKGKNHTRRAFIPNILFVPLYSRALKMKVWSCVTAATLREVDSSGGFDEYISRISLEKVGACRIALMYRERVIDAMKSDSYLSQKQGVLDLLAETYGHEYIQKLQ